MKIAFYLFAGIGMTGVAVIAWMLFYLGPRYGFLSDKFFDWQVVVFPSAYGSLLIAWIICQIARSK